ncbi:MAG: hypothetical protein A3F16_08050 [Deltaproteobacteria bacterium RIFCSPHIGHO2_12_FULL_43_9]|nr:MAG: hypothetical protein A3F16_08050 [Deltaproteobacteria bacterium RIFCSPHIGHO2_12_FULL_43_9]
MRTTLNIPENLLQEALRLLGFTSKTDVIVLALRELIRQRRIEQLKALSGHINLDIDIDKSRRRKNPAK